MNQQSDTDDRRRDAIVGLVLVLGILLIGVIWHSSSGFGPFSPVDGAARLPTLWDWMELLIVPAVLAGGALWFNRSQKEREFKISEHGRRQATLDSYYNHMTELLLSHGLRNGNLEAGSNARALTIAAIHSLDAPPSSQLFAFLVASGVDKTPQSDGLPSVHFYGANLEGIDGDSANWYGADLSGAGLYGANLSDMRLASCTIRDAMMLKADLSGAFLWKADLSRSFLDAADLTKAYLWKTRFIGASMNHAKLCLAFLFEADLSGAMLIDANLNGAEAWTIGQLGKAAALDGSVMPDGTRLRLRPELVEVIGGTTEGPSFEEWMKTYIDQHGGDEGTLRNPTEDGVDSHKPQDRVDETEEVLRSILEVGMSEEE